MSLVSFKIRQFTEDWEDTEIDDDFTNQLRKELEKK